MSILLSFYPYHISLKTLKKADARFRKFCNRTLRMDILFAKSLSSQIVYSKIQSKQHHRRVDRIL